MRATKGQPPTVFFLFEKTVFFPANHNLFRVISNESMQLIRELVVIRRYFCIGKERSCLLPP